MNMKKNIEDKRKKKSGHFQEEIFSFYKIIIVIIKNIQVVLIIPFLLCLFAIIYSVFFLKPVYESQAKIMSSSSSNSPSSNFGAQFGISLPSFFSEQKWVYPEVLKSRTLAKKILKRKYSTSKYGKDRTLFYILSDGEKHSKNVIDTLQILTVDKLISMIDITENVRTGIYTIVVRGPEPIFTAELARDLIIELEAHQAEYNKSKTSETRYFIEDRIKETKEELEKAEEALKVFNDRNRRIENSPSLQLERQRLARESTVLTGVFTTLKQQLETTKIEEVKEADYIIVIDQPEIPLWPSKPKKKVIVFLTGLFGLIFSIAFVLAYDYYKNSNNLDRSKIEGLKNEFKKSKEVFKNVRYFKFYS